MERPVTPLERLGTTIAAAQDDALARGEASDVARARARLLAGSARPRARWIPVALVAAVLALLVIALVARRPAPLTFAIGDPPATGRIGAFLAAPADAQLPVRFSDGSGMELDRGGRARVIELDAAGGRVVLERGAAHVSVVHRDKASWDFIAGPFDVRVTGTRFDLVWTPDTEELTLTMIDGTVLVSGSFLTTPRAVLTGETLRIWAKSGRLELASAKPPIEAPPPPVLPTATATTAAIATTAAAETAEAPIVIATAPTAMVAPVVKPLAEDDWRSLAGAGKYTLALGAAEEKGFSALCQSEGAADVLTLGDVARLGGAAARAREAYLAVRTRFAGSSQASLAAYALGRSAFDQKKAYAEAATWFETYLREAASGGLAREALGRLVEARKNAGDLAGARASAKRYLELYPEGPHAALARSLVE